MVKMKCLDWSTFCRLMTYRNSAIVLDNSLQSDLFCFIFFYVEDDDDEDDEGEETGSEEEPNKTSYTIKPSTEVTNTPTRITLQLSNNTTTNQTPITTTVKKGRRGKIQRKKVTIDFISLVDYS